jgi:hypothetical protein
MALPKLRLTPPKVPEEQAAADLSGKFLYGLINGHDISGFDIGAEGDLKPLSHSLFSVGNTPATLAVDRWESSFTWQTLITGMLWPLLLMRATAL